jgi:hypothetical protein
VVFVYLYSSRRAADGIFWGGKGRIVGKGEGGSKKRKERDRGRIRAREIEGIEEGKG